MNPTLKTVLAIIGALLIGGFVNGGLVGISGSIIPPPEGADLTTTEGLKAAMPLMQPKHFIMPFLAHALGSLVAGFIAAKFASTNQMRIALILGAFSLLGGIYACYLFPAPTWFMALDLIAAYLPMAYLGAKLACR
jgi:hypothetical protein